MDLGFLLLWFDATEAFGMYMLYTSVVSTIVLGISFILVLAYQPCLDFIKSLYPEYIVASTIGGLIVSQHLV